MKERNLIEDIQKTNFINERISERSAEDVQGRCGPRGLDAGDAAGNWERRSQAPAVARERPGCTEVTGV